MLSSEKIKLYNQLQVPGSHMKPFGHHRIHLLGKSDCGLLVVQNSTNGQVVPTTYNGISYRASSLSLGNGLVLCDKTGDVAGWGEMYSCDPSETEEEQNNPYGSEKVVIEKPCLLLGNRQIRKVSSGKGYFLMLSMSGSVWSMGVNKYGQLGLGNFKIGQECTEPQEISWDGVKCPFMVDIKAT